MISKYNSELNILSTNIINVDNISLYPNPNNGLFNLEFEVLSAAQHKILELRVRKIPQRKKNAHPQ